MVIKKKPVMYLDVTQPNDEGNYNLINSKNKIVGSIPAAKYLKDSEKYMADESIIPFQYTGWRKKKNKKAKSKRCRCK